MSRVALEFDFRSQEHAEACRRVLNVDPELKPHLITRTISLKDASKLLIEFESKDLRLLRVAVQGILDGLYLLVETLDAFDPTFENSD